MTNILVVDDSAFIRNILLEILINKKMDSVDEASDGFEAVMLARQKNYDIIFIDLMMPKMNGIDAIRQIRPFSPNTKIIVCTSTDQKKVSEEAFEAGANDYVVKPFDAEVIRQIVDKYSKKAPSR